MSEEKKKAVPLDLGALGPQEEKDALFRAQMAVANFVLGYWRMGLAVFGVILLIAAGYGQWRDHQRGVQRKLQASIAEVARADRTDAEAGAAYAAIAEKGEGAGAAMAWIRSAEAFDAAGEADKALASWEKAHAVGAKGVLGWSASSGLASAKAAKGDVDGAAAVLRSAATGEPSFETEQALFALAQLFEAQGRKDDARATYEEFSGKYSASPYADQVAAALARLRENG